MMVMRMANTPSLKASIRLLPMPAPVAFAVRAPGLPPPASLPRPREGPPPPREPRDDIVAATAAPTRGTDRQGPSMTRSDLRSLLGALAILAAAPAGTVEAAATAEPLPALEWRLVGPYRGGWSTMAVGVPEAPDTFYAGAPAAASGRRPNGGSHLAQRHRRAADHCRRRARRRAIRQPGCLHRHGTSGAALRRRRRERGLPLGRRREDVDGARARRDAPYRRHRGRPPRRHVVLVAAVGHVFGPDVHRGVYRSADGGKPGPGRSTSTTRPARSTSRWIPWIRTSSTPPPGRCGSGRGSATSRRSRGTAAPSGGRPTAAAPGSASRARAGPRVTSAASASRSRGPAAPLGSTRPSRARRAAASTARTMAAVTGGA